MSAINYVIAIITGLVSIMCIIPNWIGLINWIINKKNYSQIMFIGGILLCICIANTPIKNFWWLGLILDPGVLIGIYGLPSLIKQIKNK